MTQGKRVPVHNRPGIFKVQRAKGAVYEARYRVGGKVRGRTFATLDAADAFLKTTRNAVLTGDYIAPEAGRVTFGAVADAWLAGKEVKGLKARTVSGYRDVLDSWLTRFDKRPVGSITHLDIQRLLTDLAERRPQTVRNVFNVLRGVLDEAVDAGYLRANPAERFRKKLPKGKREERRFLTPQEVARLAAELAPPHDLLVTFAVWSGLRRGEVAGLRVGRLDLARNRVHVRETVIDLAGGEQRPDTPKSDKSRRTVPIPPPLARLLAEHVAAHGLGTDDYLFGNPDRTPLQMPRWYQATFRPAAARAGLAGVRFHDLRHTYASLMAHQGEDLYRVSRWMGHSTIAITADLYTHLYETEDDALQKRMAAAFLAGHTPDATVVSLPRRTG